jgi:hypothetical protein
MSFSELNDGGTLRFGSQFPPRQINHKRHRETDEPRVVVKVGQRFRDDADFQNLHFLKKSRQARQHGHHQRHERDDAEADSETIFAVREIERGAGNAQRATASVHV